MAETVPASGTIDIPLSSSNVDMHAHLHHPPLPQHTTYSSDDNNLDDKKVISASCSELSAVAAINSNNNYQQHSCSPTNLSTTCNLFRCERCDNFETNSRATLLLHVVQCLSSPAKLKSEELDPENLSLSGTSAIHHIDQAKQAASVLGGSVNSNNNHHNNSSNSSKESLSNSIVASGGHNGGNTSARKVFECDVCNMKFSNGANMRRHKMRHTGVKPYECRVCQKRFFRKDHLAEHFTTHTKTLPYHCPICNRGFQRQIAMRAHFQNEHVGQHDLVKTCPLCSYRAGSMKSLRIHFHNRHGIDLDNPGAGGSSSLLLALESQASQAAAAVAAAANFMPNISATSTIGATSSLSVNNACSNSTTNNNQSDSGESLRSTDNPTPPMHFLTPHVEISMTENNGDLFNGNHSTRTTTPTPTTTPTTAATTAVAAAAAAAVAAAAAAAAANNGDSLENRISQGGSIIPSSSTTTHLTNICASSSPRIVAQDDALDCNVKLCSSTISTLRMTSSSPKSNQYDNHILPSISLIPIKQEPSIDDSMEQIKNGHSSEESCGRLRMDNENIYNSSECNRLSSLIKVSPLKSLLREDLKRRICAKASNRVNRNTGNVIEHCNSTVIQNNQIRSSTISCNSTAICNGTITSSGQETDSSMASRKQILTCLFCGIEFPDETLYFLHKGCHCDSNPWKCNICGEQCNNVYEFNSHLLSKSHQ